MITENIILLIGIMLVAGSIMGRITHSLRITAIVGYIVAGIILGPAFHLVELSPHTMKMIVSFTLALVAFIIGGTFTADFLKNAGKSTWMIICSESFGAFILVAIGVYLVTHDMIVALILASLAPASAPAGTMAALHDCKARGPLSTTATAVVGLDDATSILIFAVTLALVEVMLGSSPSVSTTIIRPLMDVGGAIILGILIGVIFAYLAKIIRGRESMLILSLTSILICAGLAEFLDVSLILACMFLGATFINFVPSVGKTSFEIIEDILPPIYIIFFIVAGMQLRPDLLIVMGAIGIIYIICRTFGLMGGAYIGSIVGRAEPVIQKYLGFTILSQAGVAIGLACMVAGELSAYGDAGVKLGSMAITIITATSVVFEIIGPIGVRYAVGRAGEGG